MAPRRSSPARARAAVAQLPAGRPAPALGAFLPSGRALLAAAALVLATAGLYAGARSTSVFAVRSLEIRGASPAAAAEVRAALARTRGTTLLALDRDEVVARLERIPEVASAGVDRAFPHTLVVAVREERPAAVLRRGRDAWVVAASGRVLRPVAPGPRPPLPRIWIPKQTPVVAGEEVHDAQAAAAVAAVAQIPAGFPTSARDVLRGDEGLTLRLASGIELRLGDGTDVGLKLAIARCILPTLEPGEGGSTPYLDVTVAERPVSGGTLNSEVEVEC